MIIVLKPWQRAVCPGAFVIPSAALNLLIPGEVAVLAEMQLFFMVKTKPQNPPSLHPDTRAEVCAKSERILGAAAEGDEGRGLPYLIPKTVCASVSQLFWWVTNMVPQSLLFLS